MRELNTNEIKQVNGGFIFTAIKAVYKWTRSQGGKRTMAAVGVAEHLTSSSEQDQ